MNLFLCAAWLSVAVAAPCQDVFLIIDNSESIQFTSPPQWQRLRSFAVNLVDTAPTVNSPRFAAVYFGSYVMPALALRKRTPASAAQALNFTLPYMTQGETNLGQAVLSTLTGVFQSGGATQNHSNDFVPRSLRNRNRKRLIIIITDGVPTDDPCQHVNDLKAVNAQVVVVGIHNPRNTNKFNYRTNPKIQCLVSVNSTGHPQIFEADNFAKVHGLMEDVSHLLCDTTLRYRTLAPSRVPTQEPTIHPTHAPGFQPTTASPTLRPSLSPELAKLWQHCQDILLVIDHSESIGAAQWVGKIEPLLHAIIDYLPPFPYTPRIGAIGYGSAPRIYFNFTSRTQEDLHWVVGQKVTYHRGSTKLDAALEYAETWLFPEMLTDLPFVNRSRLVLIITDGDPDDCPCRSTRRRTNCRNRALPDRGQSIRSYGHNWHVGIIALGSVFGRPNSRNPTHCLPSSYANGRLVTLTDKDNVFFKTGNWSVDSTNPVIRAMFARVANFTHTTMMCSSQLFHPTLPPTVAPSEGPTTRPTGQPSTIPSTGPTVQPSVDPTIQPSTLPSVQPTEQPTVNPTVAPTSSPSTVPSPLPSTYPTTQPTESPTTGPSVMPSTGPSTGPSISPTGGPSMTPTTSPTTQPTISPTRPPVPCTAQPTQVGGAVGDPHFQTADGVAYTFNGIGEYQYLALRDGSAEVQLKTQAVNAFSAALRAIAIRIGTHRLTMWWNGPDTDEMVLFHDGAYLGASADSLFGEKHCLGDEVCVQRRRTGAETRSLVVTTRVGLRVTANYMGRASFFVELPAVYRGQTMGLIGNANGDWRDDLLRRDGEVLRADGANASDVHYAFAETWRVPKSDSLIVSSWETWKSATCSGERSCVEAVPPPLTQDEELLFRPRFSVEFGNQTFEEAARVLCGLDQRCLFDAAATGSLPYARLTKVDSVRLGRAPRFVV